MSQLQVGDILEGRYQIDHPIARGGMSTVYRCVDLRLARAVAVKVMDDRYVDDPVFSHRFRREARAMAQLSHPNLVGVFDFSSEGEYVYLVMELITGGTLRELLAERGPMPPHAATAVMRNVLTGLAAAHEAGMVHRDIKPDNVLIGADHSIKIADFGLVRAARTADSTNQILGTASYLSPEQVRGGSIGPASDVYSAGVLMFELLTGTTPFRAQTPLDRAYQRLSEDVPAPSSRIEGIPSLIDALVASATARDVENRFTDAAEFLSALDDVARDLQLPSFTVPIPQNAAAHRAANVPTDTHGLGSALAPTGVISPASLPGDHTSWPAEPTRVDPEGDGTALLPEYGYPEEPYDEPAEHPAAPAVPSTSRRSQPQITNRSGLKLAAWLVAVAVLIGGVALGAWWMGSGRYGEIPQVIGMSQTQAVSAVEDAGFSGAARLVYADSAPKDTVVGTDPDSSDKVLRGSQVTVLVSQGAPTVPAIPEDAEPATYTYLLNQRGLKYAEGDASYSDDVPEGKIVSTSPTAGQEVSTGQEIKVSLSKGPAPVEVPDVSGLSQRKAQSVLEAAGLKVGRVSTEFNDKVKADRAISTSPAAGQTVSRTSSVDLVISNAVEIPDIVGLSLDKAREKLANAGLSVGTITRDTEERADTADTVVAVADSSSDSLAKPGSSVNLVLPGKVKAPNLLGKKLADAREIATDAGLQLKTDSEAKDSDRVYFQTPLPGMNITVTDDQPGVVTVTS